MYNDVGNRISLTDRRGVQSFGYDGLDRLTSATHPLTFDQTFSYDPVGNRTTNASLYNAGNQLTEDSSFTYEYDLNGNLVRKTFKVSGNHTDYTYDAENRLIRVDEFAFGSPTPGATSTYQYDGLGRRIEKVGNGITHRYIYDGEDILLEYDETNTLPARYTHGPGVDEPIAMTRGGSTFFYHQDGLGTVTDLTDTTGTTAEAYTYDAWGNVIEQTGSIENPYQFTGREFDAETGLYYYRARYYDPTIGRFLASDPIGLAGGSNIYSYVYNNPLRYADPLGLDVNVCFYADAAAGFGHVGFGSPGGKTSGFYPTGSPYNSPGIVKPDEQIQQQCKTIESPPDKDQCMMKCQIKRKSDPGQFRLYSRQCTSYVRDCLRECGLPAGDYSGPLPASFFKDLPDKNDKEDKK